jgi:hypothetical protein
MVSRAGKAVGFPFLIHSRMLRHSCGYKLANDGQGTRKATRGTVYHLDAALHGIGTGPLQEFLAGLNRRIRASLSVQTAGAQVAASAEPHASFTLTSRYSPRQLREGRRKTPASNPGRIAFGFLGKFADGWVAIAHPGPIDVVILIWVMRRLL